VKIGIKWIDEATRWARANLVNGIWVVTIYTYSVKFGSIEPFSGPHLCLYTPGIAPWPGLQVKQLKIRLG
jgi:hypothetical protein